ncbi:MAG TPA: glycosyltransferase family A protein, partial [Ktedonobacteraceae bacterium]|nr:glycosyltransferase family A protein [Ktedonobacteraceae bacterium]
LRQWADQVDEVLLVVDLHQSKGRFSEGWQERLPGMRLLIDEYCSQYPNVRSLEVDYAPEVVASIATQFFGGKPVPAKDWNGGPFYSYFFGLYAANYDYIFHMDSDMMYGGGSSTWITEAIQLLVERPDVLICSPLPGPPTADGRLHSQSLLLEPYSSLAYHSSALSSRHFFLDRKRFCSRIQQLPLTQPPRRRVWQAQLEGNPPYNLPEVIFSQAMSAHGLVRLEFLGNAPGMWSIHPPYRSALFYERLPTLIQQIEQGNIPEDQRGCHDMNESMINWASARKPFQQRIAKHLKLALQRHV